MPTDRARHHVTETPDIARALDLASQRWPGISRGKLLVRLIGLGGSTLDHDRRAEQATHQAAVRASSGSFDDAFEAGYLASIRDDWPA